MFIIKKNNINIILKEKLNIKKNILKIYKNLKKYGDKFLKKCVKKYDNINFKKISCSIKNFKINCKEKKIIKKIYLRIYKFHYKQMNNLGLRNWKIKDKYFKILGQRINEIKKVMVYVPGGKYCYISTLLMNVIPAKIAGVKKIYISTPSKGECFKKIVYLCNKLKIKKIYRMGGAHAIFSSAIGTQKVEKVDKIVGPGNIYVNEAKKIVYGRVGIDSLAGPTEILIIMGNKKVKNKEIFNAYSQLEHGITSKVYILSYHNKQFLKIIKLFKIYSKIINFKNIFLIKTKCMKECISISNKIAPEHLMVYCRKIKLLLPKIKNFGTIFIGKNSIESTGDYYAGSNHVLPTNQNSFFSSPLSVNDFLKSQNILKVNKKYLDYISNISYLFSNIEGLKYHSLSSLCMIK
ncbi:histidinol dehydrogenase [Candidatus Vidania fulgoroideorum]